MSDPTRNPARSPTRNTNTDQTEVARQRQGRANAFFFNGLELADPNNKQKNTPKAVKSNDFRLALLNGRLTQLSLTLQQQLATTQPDIYRVNPLPSLYGTPSGSIYIRGGASGFTRLGNAFRFTGNQTFEVADADVRIDYFMIGGGGGGGNYFGNGGSGGTVNRGTSLILSPGLYTVTIGSGGTGAPAFGSPTDGTASTLVKGGTTVLSAAGGALGSNQGGSPGAVGGSGAGGAFSGRAGGPGLGTNLFDGTTTVFYGGGGGGSWYPPYDYPNAYYSPGGSGVGGGGGWDNNTAGLAAVANTGSGGGGGGGAALGTMGPGGNGSAGILILRIV